MIKNCEIFYKAANGDSCDKIVASFGGIFTSEEFISWNPAAGENFRDLWAGYYYCVGIPGTPTTPPKIPNPTETTSIPRLVRRPPRTVLSRSATGTTRRRMVTSAPALWLNTGLFLTSFWRGTLLFLQTALVSGLVTITVSVSQE